MVSVWEEWRDCFLISCMAANGIIVALIGFGDGMVGGRGGKGRGKRGEGEGGAITSPCVGAEGPA